MKSKNFLQSNFAVILIVLFYLIFKAADLYADYLWFDSLGFKEIFTISLTSKIAVFVIATLAFFLFAIINIWIASKLTDPKNKKLPFKVSFAVIVFIAILFGIISYSSWLTFLKFFNQVPFNLEDPIFFKDISFYLFSLPVYLAVWRFVISTVFITIILTALYYFQSIISTYLSGVAKQPTFEGPEGPVPAQSINIKSKLSKISRKAYVHLALLGSLVFILFSFKNFLNKFSVMYSDNGIVVGAGYTDVVAYIPILQILMVLAIVIAILFLLWIFVISKQPKLRKRHIVFYAIAIYLLFDFVGPVLIPGIIQSIRVTPNEINLEKPYIENNIKYTNIAYGLDEVEERDFEVELSLSSEILDQESETIDNVRILDWRPLTQTYKQTQEIRLYYDLSGIDIDRYNINGKYTQVMIAPRELDQNQLADNAKTWVNEHLVYTHGYGVVMSPVNTVTDQGLPNYLIKDIPPVNSINESSLEIENPRIYYGEKENNFVLVNTKNPEFDFPKGNENEYIKYDGKGGVVLDSFMKKLAMVLKFKDLRILLSSDITDESKIMFLRNIQDRINRVTPFLALDEDPYLVIHEGRLVWIQDAFTITDRFPYSQKVGKINYIRNSVKVVVDAYSGQIDYYILDDKDPLIQAYNKVFPFQFKTFDQMPDNLKKHIRYPEDLFKVQSEIYSTYHMNDPTVFYNKEDAWQIPYEIYGPGQQVRVDPYYIIMKLPREQKEEFVMMTSFTPIKKDNMIAWLAARMDGENYGKLLLFKFPKDKLVYGPLQIEARIDQDSEISQQLTLWSQQGSSVTRGNLLVIPIENSLLYIEPLYIQAEKGQLPELKRVLISDGERIVMEKDLATGLEKLFGKSKKKVSSSTTIISNGNLDKTESELIKDANQYYEKILDSMNQNDWEGIGENFDRLGEVLEELKE